MSASHAATSDMVIQAPISGPFPEPAPLIAAPDSAGLDVGSYHAILDHIDDGVCFVNRKKQVLLWSRGAEAITGFSRAEIMGESCDNRLLCHVDESGRLLCMTGCPLQIATDAGVPIEADAFLQHKLGHRIPVRIKTSPVRNDRNQLIGAVEIFKPTSEARRQEHLIEELSQLAMIDDLTRMPNRRHFDMQLERRLAELNRFGWPFGTLMIDLDDFKQVNDRFGHQTGDAVLQMVGRTLSANCRALDTVARWGGEEFAAIIANVHADDLRKVAEKFRAMIDAGSVRDVREDPLHITVSIGCAVARPDESAAELIRRTDEMLYAAKRSGRNRVCL